MKMEKPEVLGTSNAVVCGAMGNPAFAAGGAIGGLAVSLLVFAFCNAAAFVAVKSGGLAL